MTDSTENTTAAVHRYAPEFPEYDSSGIVIEVEMPEGAQVLSFTPVGFYALVNTGAPMKTRRFFMISTGHPIERPDLLRYICTPAHGRHLFKITESLN